MLIVIEHTALKVRTGVHAEKLLASAGMTEEDIARCSPTVPPDLKADVRRAVQAIHRFIAMWATATPEQVIATPEWVVYVQRIPDDAPAA